MVQMILNQILWFKIVACVSILLWKIARYFGKCLDNSQNGSTVLINGYTVLATV